MISAANPIYGRYDPQRNFLDNVDLTEPILSRFDILSVIRDEVDPHQDKALATFVINSHIRSHPDLKNAETEEEKSEFLDSLLDDSKSVTYDKNRLLDQEFLKKYIIYCRKYIHPKLGDVDKERITQFYADIRKYSNQTGGIPIGVRHIESMLRMSEAHAKMHLREHVRPDDINVAIRMLLESFLQSQKQSIASAMRPKFSKYLSKVGDDTQLCMHILRKMATEKVSPITLTSIGKIQEDKRPRNR